MSTSASPSPAYDAEDLRTSEPVRLSSFSNASSGDGTLDAALLDSSMGVAPRNCSELLERVIGSRELKRALRLRDLIEFIGRRALQPNPGTLREQEIGAAVFGRPDEYDTNLDNIVRVNVSELRKRLAHYFENEGSNESMVIEIPRGGYLPIFLYRPQVPSNGESNLLPDEAKLTPKPVESSPALDSAEPVQNMEQHFDAKTSADLQQLRVSPLLLRLAQPHWLALAAFLFLATAGAAGWFAWQSHRLAAQIQPWRSDPALASLWSEFFDSGQDVDIVTADTSFALAEDLAGAPLSLQDYLDYKYKNVAERPGLDAGTRNAILMILDRNNGSIGDFHAAQRIFDLNAQSPYVKMESARSFTTESIKTSNVILIGGRQSNPWVELYRDRMNFFLDYDPVLHRAYVSNHRPLAGEKTIYESSGDPGQGYSVVAFLPNLTEHRYAMILSGVDSQATRASAEFVTSSEGMSQVRAKVGTNPSNGRLPYFEVLLSSRRLVGTTLHTEIIAYRVHSN
jgi:hypothetical protein